MSFSRLTKKYQRTFWEEITNYGGSVFYFVLVLFVWSVESGPSEIFYKLIAIYVATLAVAFLIRAIYFKERPAKEVHGNFLEKLDASSFPSIHAARSAALTIIFLFEFPVQRLTYLIIIIALLVAWSRVFLKKHDLIDVVAGALLGIGIGWVVIQF